MSSFRPVVDFLDGMGDVIQKTMLFLRGVGEILCKRDGNRAKCPRCKGSGLLALQPRWSPVQPNSSNSSCLFCEGVGVLPIVGLRGFMLGRADAMINTKNIKRRSTTLDTKSSEEFLGRNSSRLTSCKNFESSPSLLYNPLSKTEWLQEADREALSFNSTQLEVVEKSDHRDCDDCSGDGLIGLGHGGWQYRHRFYARTSTPFSNPKCSLIGIEHLSNIPSHFSRSDGQAAGGLLDLKGSELRQLVGLSSLGRPGAGVYDPEAIAVAALETRRRKYSRRPRNRIREEAAKEAEDRARRIHYNEIPARVNAQVQVINSWNLLLAMCTFALPARTEAAKKS